MSKRTVVWSAAVTASVLACAPAAQAVLIVNTGFEEGSYAATGLTDFSTVGNNPPVLTAGIGVNGSTGLDVGSDGAAVSASRAIDAQTAFSMFGKFNGNAQTANGTMTFGWTQAAGEYNPYSGVNTGVLSTDHVIAGLVRDAGNTFRLSAANGAHGQINTSGAFGSAGVTLTSGNWYRLEGTILFNPTTKTFTFNNFSLDDFGTTGASEVTPNVLSGTGQTVTAATFGTTGRMVFATNRDRGFQVTDNFRADAVPEPATAGLLAAAAVGLLGRRRRRK